MKLGQKFFNALAAGLLLENAISWIFNASDDIQ